MTPNDPRHGTIAGVNAHQRSGVPTCDPCKRAKMRYEKQRLLAGGNIKVPAVGTRRRILALRALGYSLREIAEAGGWKTGHAALKYPLVADTITADTANRVAAVYDQLSMTPATGPRANRNRRLAERNDWAPPLAWDDIDNPDEVPDRGAPDAKSNNGAPSLSLMLEDAEWLADDGMNLTAVLARLGVSRNTLRDACRREGRADLYWRLALREPDADNRRATREGIKRAKENAA